MVKEISIITKDPNVDLKLNSSKFNLFIGPNGSGKSFTLEKIWDYFNNLEQKTLFLSERRIKRRDNDELPSLKEIDEDQIKESYANYNFQSERSIIKINNIVKKLFNREIKNIAIRGLGMKPCYHKKSQYVQIVNDSLGVSCAMSVLEALFVLPKSSYLFIEDITLGLHPSVIQQFLNIVFENAFERDITIFCTTQDFVCCMYFFKKLKESNFKIFSFNETDEGFTAIEINEKNQREKMKEFVGNFPSMDDFKTMSDFIS